MERHPHLDGLGSVSDVEGESFSDVFSFRPGGKEGGKQGTVLELPYVDESSPNAAE